MKTSYLDPLIPRGESIEATLRRLSSNINTLTGLIGDAERTGHLYLAGMFSDARATKVTEAQAVIALVKEEKKNAVEEAAISSLATEGGQRPEPDNKDGRRGERPKADMEFFPAEALLLMDTPAVEPERRFLLVGISLAGMGAAAFAPRRPRRERIRFALMEGVSFSPLAYPHFPDQQPA